jgi:hypothetical protein
MNQILLSLYKTGQLEIPWKKLAALPAMRMQKMQAQWLVLDSFIWN